MTRRFVLLLCLTVLVPKLAMAAYSSLYVFGDSLSDGGNAYALSNGAWPPSPPYAERFTNGPTAAEVLAAQLGIVGFGPSATGGTNHAVGGATTGTGNFNYLVGNPPGLPPVFEHTGIQAQVGAFSGTIFDPASSLFMVWGGPNDVFLGLALGHDLGAVAGSAVANIAASITQLALLGATDFLVPNMPDLAVTPFGLALDPTSQNALALLSAGFNAGLAATMEHVRTTLGPLVPALNIVEFDVALFLATVIADPDPYGFSNVTDPCFALPSCDGALFVDAVHPTAHAHALLGAAFAAAVTQQVPEPVTLAMVALGLFALGGSRRWRRARAK